jgi:hypothetical protein
MAVARVTEVTASSKKGWDYCAKEAISRAGKSLRGITGLEVVSMKAKVDGGKIIEYRLTCKITFVLED